MKNHRWLIHANPLGRALSVNDFKLEHGPLASPKKGELVVRVLFLSMDPIQKGWMESAGGHAGMTKIGDVMPGRAIGEVVESTVEDFQPGDKVMGPLGWQEYAVTSASGLIKLVDDQWLTANLGVLGANGLAAYYGLFKHGRPVAGDHVFVTGAAGATGSIAGQLAKIAGCKVIGVAGNSAKCDWLTRDLLFDEAFDYTSGDLNSHLTQACPDGVNVFFDNVGGPLLNIGLGHLAMHARVVICGGISRSERGAMPEGPENYFNLIYKRASMQGFVVSDYAEEDHSVRNRLACWLTTGQLRYKEDVVTGFDKAPDALIRIFSGENIGKQLVRITH